ncbi:MAG: 16S rRNA (cytidine(1402)-2'-O)-methyltransferase [Coriobacteriales bacterium]|jgi:16S rRNA (cytidine1402-2'-O)-methyltransferase|nr:16S rRNA (cytidine(1402)-2'-O)-methyltransferase [Coriobacteriales bacterium]
MLSICATPIGNLGDVTLRVLDTLRRADAILAEDTRVTRKLLAANDIHTSLERCDANVLAQRLPQLLARLEAGEHLAYVSDAGMPGISDPGLLLVAAARQAGLAVEVLPGASAVLTALVAAGLAGTGSAFYFGGFLPRKEAQIRTLLNSLAELDAALVFYESPHRAARTLALIAEVFAEREVALARELTKLHEEVLRLPAPELAAQIAAREAAGQPLKGEVALVISPPVADKSPRQHVDKYASGEA